MIYTQEILSLTGGVLLGAVIFLGIMLAISAAVDGMAWVMNRVRQ